MFFMMLNINSDNFINVANILLPFMWFSWDDICLNIYSAKNVSKYRFWWRRRFQDEYQIVLSNPLRELHKCNIAFWYFLEQRCETFISFNHLHCYAYI